MRNSFQRVIATLNLFQGKQSLTIFMLAAIFALSACEDSSSAGGDNGSGGNRGGIPDTVETFMELSDYDCGKNEKCVSTYLVEYHGEVVCDGDNGWVFGTLIEKMDCDFSSSSDKVTDKDSEPAEVSSSSVESSDSKSSSSVKSGDSSSSSSAGKVNGLATPCKTETEDNCEYGELVDERDGQTYKTVKIGDQWWMAENLNYEYKVNDSTYGNYCYKDSTQYCDKYGRLYTWGAAMDSATTGCGYGRTCTATHPVQGICPSGWHLPDTTDWHDLIVAAGGQYSAGAKLKSTSGWENDGWGNDGNGTDAFGFSALPSGYRSRGGEDYYTAGGYAYIWSSFEYITGLVAYEMGLRCTNASAYVERGSEDSGYAVRCLKDSE